MAARGMSEGRRRALLVAASLGAVVVVSLAVALVVFFNGRPGASPAVSAAPFAADLPAPSFDLDAPAFPVPPGATLVNAQVVGGSGPGAARIAAWTSPLTFDATVAFYAGLADPRWSGSGSPATTPSSTTLSFTDTRAAFAGADVAVDRTDPVRISVVFRSASPVPAPSGEPGPTIAFATLPPATALPDGFPARLVPANGSLVDAAGLDGTYDAIFTSTADPATLSAAYQTALSGFASAVGVHADGTATVIDFATPGGPGEVVIAPGSAGTTVSVEVRP